MKKEELVSIVVPVYNVEEYLEKCLNSIVNQTYKNLEIVCIDDGSPDHSINILNKFAEKDNRIKIIRQKNKGLSGARNTGIKNSSGKYITFVDSDDWIEKNMIELLLKKAESENLDLVICGRNHIKYSEIKSIGLNKIDKILSGRILNGKEYFLEITSKTNLFTASAYNKLYLLEKIKKENLNFPEGRIYEDLLFIFKYLYFSKRVNIIDKALYNYVVSRENSITYQLNKNDIRDTEYTLKQVEDFLRFQKEEDFLKNQQLKDYLFLWMLRAVTFKLIKIKSEKVKLETLTKLKNSEIFHKYLLAVILKGKKLKLRLIAIILLINKKLYLKILKLYFLSKRI